MERLAPKPVLDNLSAITRHFLERRLNPDGTLTPYLEVFKFLRIRGINPTIQYVTYSSYNPRWELETMYVSSAEEEQTEWVAVMKRRLEHLSPEDRQIAATQESSWCIWEDAFINCSTQIPLLTPFSKYLDYMGNTQTHMLAYACLYRKTIDLELFNANFQAIRFDTNFQITAVNHLAQTPIMILLGSTELHEFAESLMLRLPFTMRLAACPFSHWQPTWGTLMNLTVNNSDNLEDLIERSRKMEGFFTKFIAMVHYNSDAIDSLFQAGYKLYDWHIRNYNFKVEAAMRSAVISASDWHNLTFLLSFSLDASFTSITFFNANKNIIRHRSSIIKEEIVAKALHPDRIDKLIRMGYHFDELIDHHL